MLNRFGCVAASLGAAATLSCGPDLDDCRTTLTCPPSPTTSGSGGQTGAGGSASGAGGSGGGASPDGTPCDAASECQSGHCVDGVCCNSVCDTACEACDVAGVEGACSPHPRGTDPDGECGPSSTCGGSSACVGMHLWSKRFGGGATDAVVSVALDGSENIVLAGTFEGTIAFGGAPLSAAGGTDIFVAKLASDGSHLWSKRFDNGTNEDIVAAAVDASENIVLVGAFGGSVSFGGALLNAVSNPDVFVVKLGTAGEHVWSKRFGGMGYEVAESVLVDTNGNVLVSGVYYGSVDFGGGTLPLPTSSANAYLVKLNTLGNHVWSRGFGGTSEVGWSSNLAVDTADNVILTATFQGTANLGGSDLSTASGVGLGIAKYNASGLHVWSKGFGESGNGRVATDGPDVYLCGSFSNSIGFGGTAPLTSAGGDDSFVVKFQPNGVHTWSKHFGDPAEEAATAVSVAPNGDVLVAGSFSGGIELGAGGFTSAGGFDTFALLMSGGGEHRWSARFGDAAQDHIAAVALGDAQMVVAGWFASTIDLGGGTLTSAGADDIFVAAFTP